MAGMPYMGRAARSQSQPLGLPVLSDLLPRTILGTHPQQVLADKLDAVCWREGLVPTQGDKALNRMVERIRDHYDIYCLIKWLRANSMLDADAFLATVERTKEQERKLRERMRLTRAERVGAHNSVVGADQGFRAPSGDQESVRDSVHEDSASARIAAGQRPRQSFRHAQPRARSCSACPLSRVIRAVRSRLPPPPPLRVASAARQLLGGRPGGRFPRDGLLALGAAPDLVAA